MAKAVEDGTGRPAAAKSAKRRMGEIAENILNTDAARLPRRGNGRVQVAELARQVRIQMAAEGEPPPLGMIDRYIRTYVRQWEERNPDK